MLDTIWRRFTYEWMPNERKMDANLVWPARLNFNLSKNTRKKEKKLHIKMPIAPISLLKHHIQSKK